MRYYRNKFWYQLKLHPCIPRQRQFFSLPFGIMCYLMNGCTSPKVFEKLQKSCKHFFSQKKIVVACFGICVGKICRWISYGLKNEKTCRRSCQLQKNLQLWLTNTLVIERSTLPLLMEYAYRCDLEELIVDDNHLTFKDICFLLNGGKIQKLNLFHVSIKYDDGTPVTIDVILSKCPRINSLTYINICETFASDTFEKLSHLKFANQIRHFWIKISQKQGVIDPYICCEFLKNRVVEFINIVFDCDIPRNEFEDFRTIVRKTLGDSVTVLKRKPLSN